MEALGSLLDGGEDTGGLNNVVGADGAPGDGSGVLLTEDGDGLAVDDELTVLGLDGALEAAVYGIVLEHVGHVVEGDEGAVEEWRMR